MISRFRKYRYRFPEDQALIVQGCIENDRNAQEVLYRYFFPVMEKLVRRYTQDDDKVIDILNNGFLRVFKKIEKYENRGSFEGWIRKIIFHSISNYFRKKDSDLKFLIYEDYIKSEPLTLDEHQLYYSDLMNLVKQLPENYMKVFLLFAVEGYSHEEISNQLGINRSTCRWYLSEAKKNLRNAYSKNYLNSSNEKK